MSLLACSFYDHCPQDDDAERYCRERGMHVPFLNELFLGGEAPLDRGNLVPGGKVGLVTCDVRFTGSMKWSGRGTHTGKVCNVPYVAGGSNVRNAPVIAARIADDKAHAPIMGRKRLQERSPSNASNDSSSDEPDFQYTDLPSTDSGATYTKYVGRVFDDDEDGGAFKVLAVCDMRKVGGRRSTNVVYAFKYVDIDGSSDDYMYTPVREMLNSYWCKWRDNQPRGGRAIRHREEQDEARASSISSSSARATRASRI